MSDAPLPPPAVPPAAPQPSLNLVAAPSEDAAPVAHQAPSSTPLSLVAEADALVQEYLIWRGFANTLAAFHGDASLDTLGQLSTRRLSTRLVEEVEGLRLEGVFTWWHEGVGQTLSRIDEESAGLGRALRDSTLRWYCVEAVRRQRPDLVVHFFKEHWASRVGSTRFRDEWRRQWFALPYTPAPERDRYFAPFFTPEWRDSLVASVENFLTAVFQAMPPPRLVALATARDTIAELKIAARLASSAAAQPPQSQPPPPLSASRHAVEAQEDLEPRHAAAPASAPAAPVRAGQRRAGLLRARFSPSCASLAAGGLDATVAVWPRPSSRVQVGAPPSASLFCAAAVSALDWHDDRTLAVGTWDGTVRVWSLAGAGFHARTGALLPRVTDLQFNPGSAGASLVVSACAARAATGELQVWSVPGERVERALFTGARCLAVRFNHNGALLAAAGADGTVRVFDAARVDGAIMSWRASELAGLAGLALGAAETSCFAVDERGAVREWSLHKPGEVLGAGLQLPWTADVGERCDLAAAHSGRLLAVAAPGQALAVLSIKPRSQAEGGGGDGISSSEDGWTLLAQDGGRFPALATTVDFDEDEMLVGCHDGSLWVCAMAV